MSDIKSFINELKQLNESDCFNIFVPSINKNVKFRAFSVKQHKDLVKSLLDNVEGTISMYKVFDEIVFDNSLEKINFYLYDRNKILIELRKQCISNMVKVDDVEYDLNTLPEFQFDFPLTSSFSYKGITIEVAVPSLEDDLRITEKSIVEFNKLTSGDRKAGSSLNILLIYELVKFIRSIEIEGKLINLKDISIYDRKNIIDNLPLKLNNDALEYIGNYKEYEQSLHTFPDGTKLTIDASFLSKD